MVPVVTRAPNITNISCWKIAPKALVYIDPRILLIYYIFIPGKTIQDWIERYFSYSAIFPNFDVYFINRYLTVWGFTIVFPQVPLFKKLLEFSFHLLIPAQGQFVTIKTSQDEFPFGKNFFCTETTYFTHRKDFFWQGTGVGVTKAPFVNFSASRIFDLAKVPLRFFESRVCVTGAAAAELRWHLSNKNVIFNR